MTNTKVLFTEEEIHLAQYVQIIKALKITEAELPAEITLNRSPNQPPVGTPIDEAIGSVEQKLLKELPTFIESIPDDVLQEALIRLLEVYDSNSEAITKLDLLEEVAEEEAHNIIKEVSVSGDELAQAWDDLINEVEGYVEDVLNGVTR
ncbi:hypothetical protein F8160_09435 [Bacillus sp. CH126_4D]|uniref:hypothetical protein n=1 Tax=unclassified Bacillus (in: firmicutes) TaxID=185979 RepID=UPI00124F02D7|nr:MULTISPECIES: hypothetical protein [unclassified Bacillus (in: firmicutes)]KAB2454645.1 hypothetical protein F8162_18070 [Bacillus sp. CH140a_4T]KAB2473591.1 hypothetical protein F8160_09435 [Bacillus sp. CH126_4D]